MFCTKCGKEIPDGAKFCSACGATQDTLNAEQPSQQVNMTAPAQNFQPTPQQKPKSKGKKIGGIILAVLGAMAILGSCTNGTFANIAANGADMSDIVAIILEIGMIVGGIYLIYKSKK